MIDLEVREAYDTDDFINAFLHNQFHYESFHAFLQSFKSEQSQVPKPDILCAVFKGGGVKVTGYLGVLMAMQERGLIDKLHYVAGSSGGAIFALLLGLGFDGYQIVRLFEQLDMSDLTDKRDSPLGSYFAASALSQLFSILTNGKVYSGKNIRDWATGLVEHVLGDKDASFADLHEARKKNPTLKEMYFVATKLRPEDDESQETVFGFENKADVRIVDAFCASTALPPVYSPILVREKNGKPLGYYNDGGLLNNFPVGVFDQNKFCERHYRLNFTRYRDNVTSQAVNPCAIGCSLISHLDQLDPEITPFTDRLYDLTGTQKKAASKEEGALEKRHVWSHWDMVKALLKYKFGKLEAEDSEKKYQTHPENIIQIYVENVDTTEFNLSKEKTKLIVESGRNAFDLWYKKFRNPELPYDERDYIIQLALTEDERALKRENPRGYHIEKAADHLGHLASEIIRLQGTPVEGLKKNLRIIHLCKKVLKDLRELLRYPDPEKAMAQAFAKASETYQIRQNRIRQIRVFLDHIVDIDGIMQQLRHMLVNIDKNKGAFERLLEAQLSKAFVYCLEHQDALINVAAKMHAEYIEYIVSHLREKHEHLYQIGRAKEHSIEFMLNTVPQKPILYSANRNPDLSAVKTCLKLGLDPTMKHKGGKTALHDAVDCKNVPALCEYIDYIKQRRISLQNFTFGPHQQPFIHYLIQNGSVAFLERFQNIGDGAYYNWLMSQVVLDRRGVNALEQLGASKGVYYWRYAVDRLYADSKVLFSETISSYKSKVLEYKKHLEHVKESLMTANYFNPDNLKSACNEDLLALLDDETEENLILQSIRKHWNGFVTQYFERLLTQGFHREIEVLINTPIQGKTFAQHAQASENMAVSQYFQRLTGKAQEQAQAANDDMIYQFAQTECDYRLRQFERSRETLSAPSLSRLSLNSSAQSKQSLPLSIVLDPRQLQILRELQRCFLEQQINMKALDGIDLQSNPVQLLEYAGSHDDELSQVVKAFLNNPQFKHEDGEGPTDEAMIRKKLSQLKL